MVKKIDRNIEDLKIGLLGLRSHLLTNNLEKRGITNFISMNSETEITSDMDFIFVSGYYKIIKEKYIERAKYGIYCFHESPLPEGRGYAPIQWALSNNRKNLTISLFKIDKGVDTGLISCQYNVEILRTDCYYDIEEKRKTGLQRCFSIFLDELSEGFVVLRKQNGKGSYQKKRSPKDSELIEKEYTIETLWESIRMCDNDNFPAFFKINDKKVILNYKIVDDC